MANSYLSVYTTKFKYYFVLILIGEVGDGLQSMFHRTKFERE